MGPAKSRGTRPRPRPAVQPINEPTHAGAGIAPGPPVASPKRDDEANGFVPPLTVHTGLASLVIRPGSPGSWRSTADVGWLVDNQQYPHKVRRGCVIVVTQGPGPAVVDNFKWSRRTPRGRKRTHQPRPCPAEAESFRRLRTRRQV